MLTKSFGFSCCFRTFPAWENHSSKTSSRRKLISSRHAYYILHLEGAPSSRNILVANKFPLNRKVIEDYLKCLQSRNDRAEKPSFMFPGNWIQSADLKDCATIMQLFSQNSNKKHISSLPDSLKKTTLKITAKDNCRALQYLSSSYIPALWFSYVKKMNIKSTVVAKNFAQQETINHLH